MVKVRLIFVFLKCVCVFFYVFLNAGGTDHDDVVVIVSVIVNDDDEILLCWFFYNIAFHCNH